MNMGICIGINDAYSNHSFLWGVLMPILAARMNLIKDLEEMILKHFEKYNISYSDLNRFDNDDKKIHVLLCEYLNTLSKIIMPTPRNVLISKELKSKLESNKIPRERIVIYNEIKIKFEEGFDVTPYGSQKLYKSHFYDFLRLAWGIHHLHLNNTKKKDSDYMFIGCNCLLFYIVQDHDVYFIDILEHEPTIFSKQKIPKIVKNNWPEIFECCKVHGLEAAGYNEKEVNELRNCGINTIEEGGYIPIHGGGISLIKTNLMQSVYADKLIERIREDEKRIINNEVSIREEFSKTVPDLPDNLDFHLFLDDHDYIIKEINTDTELILNCVACDLLNAQE